MKYRKKPLVIEAFRLGLERIPNWFQLEFEKGNITQKNENPDDEYGNITYCYCEIKTLEGTMKADLGDYIIQGVNGEIYPCKPDIFEKTYEKVEVE